MTTDSSDDAPTIGSGASTEIAAADMPRLAAGQAFGPYTVLRLLGRGGMGEVYEAEHRDHGRRVALKVVKERLAGAADRERFLREGQLAALINHPNTVYIFGSEEIAGTPIIAMELVAGGTLKERVDREGPLPPSEAVDAVLQVVAGLEAAHAHGILHRDVKPSNCFISPDGTIKIGDFGLSIPVVAPDVTRQVEPAGVHGTPQFAAPEQLRGQTLDLRADIYAVGATLYYLLTGRPPFEDAELMALLTRVATEAPEPPRRDGTRIPPGLSAVVLRCLAKDPAARPASYAALAEALRPFGSGVPVPARLGLRLMAGAFDWLLLTIATAPATLGIFVELTGQRMITFGAGTTGVGDPGGRPWTTLAVCVVPFLYYVLLEGIGSRSVGKRLCGLAVMAKSGEPAGLGSIAWRSLLFLMPLWLLVALSTPVGQPASPAGGWRWWVLTAVNFGLPVLMFSSIRRRNGFAAWHDLLSGTRVVTRHERESRIVLTEPRTGVQPKTIGADPVAVGPFEVIDAFGGTESGRLLLGFDPVLKRRVWLHVRPAGSPAVGSAITALGRPGRLRWMTGRRSESEAWDAFEAPDGAPLLAAAEAPQSWQVVRHWLADLSRELAAAEADGTTPLLALDRVWITGGSQARLLPFPAPGVPDGDGCAGLQTSPQQFLAAVSARALGGTGTGRLLRAPERLPLPLSAQAALDTLARDGFPGLGEVAGRFAALATGPARVSRGRRSAAMSLANLPVVFATIALLAAIPTVARILTLDFMTVSICLLEIRDLESDQAPTTVKRRELLEVYVVDRFGASLKDEHFWQAPTTTRLMMPLRPVAERALAAHPTIPDQERADAKEAARSTLLDVGDIRPQVAASAAMVIAIILAVSAGVSVVSAAAFRGGPLLWFLGLAVVAGRGARASRLRAGGRALVAWSPAFALWGYGGVRLLAGVEIEQAFTPPWPLLAAALVLLVGSVWTLVAEERGPLDRLTGTHLVPR